jgi:hypothetical protein
VAYTGRRIVLLGQVAALVGQTLLHGCDPNSSQSNSADASVQPAHSPSSTHDEKHFVSLALNIGGGTCLSCWRILRLEAPNIFVAQDESGADSFEIADDDYQRLLSLTVDGEFESAIAHPKKWDCPVLTDPEVHVVTLWSDGASDQARVSDSCFGYCDQTDHPFMKIKRALFALKEKYVSCKAPEDRYPEYCGTFPMTPPPVVGRMLCMVCLDDCGVPIPDGVPQRH